MRESPEFRLRLPVPKFCILGNTVEVDCMCVYIFVINLFYFSLPFLCILSFFSFTSIVLLLKINEAIVLLA